MRCWSADEARPSVYSGEAKLPRFLGKSGERDAQRRELESAYAEHYGVATPRRRTPWGGPGASSLRDGGGDAGGGGGGGGGAADGGRKKAKKGLVLAPVPYRVPEPPEAPGLVEAATALVAFYEEAGVEGGGAGLLFGLRIDHVLLAVTGGRTRAPLAAPLMALAEVVYADVLLPMLDTVAVARDEWAFALERVVGIVRQVQTMSSSYASCVGHVKRLLLLLLELSETMRQVLLPLPSGAYPPL